MPVMLRFRVRSECLTAYLPFAVASPHPSAFAVILSAAKDLSSSFGSMLIFAACLHRPYDVSGFGFSVSMPRSLIAFSTTDA